LWFSRRWLWRMPFCGIKKPVRTSQETHDISATEPSRLMLCKIWGFHSGEYGECRLLGYKTQFVPHRRHITSPLQSPALRKICGFHGRDYEECRLLGYRNPVHTSQETHCFSATEPRLLKLWEIWSFHSGDYEECCFLGCWAVWVLLRTGRRNVSFPSSGQKKTASHLASY
jgi:hypothetical protein